jgi:hypothetical protein
MARIPPYLKGFQAPPPPIRLRLGRTGLRNCRQYYSFPLVIGWEPDSCASLLFYNGNDVFFLEAIELCTLDVAIVP